jgi:hypothetical protein
MFWGSGGVAVRAGLKIGQVFGQTDYEGFREAKIGWALCILYMKEKFKEKCKQHRRNAVAAVTEPNRKPEPVLS